VGLPVPFVCNETYELGEELVGSYRYQVHLLHWLESNVYGSFCQTNDLHIDLFQWQGSESAIPLGQQRANSISYITEIIQTALADSNDSDPSATAATKIQDRASVWKAQKHTKLDLDTVRLESMADEIKIVSSRSVNERDALKQLLNREEGRLSLLSVRAALVKTGGPQ
jgi:hypothetical protein